MKKKCKKCGRPFVIKNRHYAQKFCSLACSAIFHLKGRKWPERWKYPPTPCKWCKMVFKPIGKGHLFCSKACATRHLCKDRPGWYRTTKGYILAWKPEHPNTSKTGYMMQHRLVMEASLGRLLRPDEVVHHKNGVKDDNRLRNLELMAKRKHDGLPKKRKTTICCPHCGKGIRLSNAARSAKAI